MGPRKAVTGGDGCVVAQAVFAAIARGRHSVVVDLVGREITWPVLRSLETRDRQKFAMPHPPRYIPTVDNHSDPPGSHQAHAMQAQSPTRKRSSQRWAIAALFLTAGTTLCNPVKGDEPRDVLAAAKWRQVDQAVDRGIAYLAQHQRADGSIDAPRTGQPGITSLAVLAFLSCGHIPGEGPYGAQLLKAIDFVRSCQRENGILSAAEPESHHVHNGATHAGNYNHAIAGLMLTEVYGMLSDERARQTAETIVRALKFTRHQQTRVRSNPNEKGGWRYLRGTPSRWEADISVSSWQLMFYRSAKNAGFEVPVEFVDEAMEYIRRGFDPAQKSFTYNLPGGANLATRGVAGGAVVSLALGDENRSEQALYTGDWILKRSFRQYNQGPGPYHYGAFYCSQAMCQLGGDYWKQFFPPLAETLLAHQAADGSWEVEAEKNGDYFGRNYTTSLSILALTPAYQLLPIYQR